MAAVVVHDAEVRGERDGILRKTIIRQQRGRCDI
jgi:hypothetical protein